MQKQPAGLLARLRDRPAQRLDIGAQLLERLSSRLQILFQRRQCAVHGAQRFKRRLPAHLHIAPVGLRSQSTRQPQSLLRQHAAVRLRRHKVPQQVEKPVHTIARRLHCRPQSRRHRAQLRPLRARPVYGLHRRQHRPRESRVAPLRRAALRPLQ